jgi:tRNA-binding EMAP/Myf-like protein
MENNTCFIAKIGNFQPIEGADKIESASILLNDVPITRVVIGKGEYNEGDLVVYFDSNLCLSDEFILYIDKQHKDFGKENFTSVSKYLARGNRIKTVKLRGIISDGLVISPEKFESLLDKKTRELFVEGFSFNDLGGMHVCHKYVAPVKQRSTTGSKKGRKKRKLISRVIPEMFKFHCDTAQLAKNLFRVNPNTVASISRKIHGTSGICSKAKVLKKLSWYEKALKKIGLNLIDTEYSYLYASRTVIKNDLLNGTDLCSTNVWQHAGEKHFTGKLHNGETVYFEIVGYLPDTQTFIQKPFDYGCLPGEYKIAVYRITLTSDDGAVSEYSWNAMKERCKELDVPTVEEFYYGKLGDMYKDIAWDENWNVNFLQRLQDEFLEGDCPLCRNKVPEEGIVIRPDTLYIEPYKLKSKRFVLKESELKEKKDFVDIEDGGSI